MPFVMSGPVQSVVVQGTLYVGGGYNNNSSLEKLVMKYDIQSGEWATLPQYRASLFAMAVIKNQLVLVGGSSNYVSSKVLGVWRVDGKDWTHPYPDMPTARYGCSAAVHAEWLVVAGSYTAGGVLPSVEVLNTDAKQWYTGPPLPTAAFELRTAIVGDILYCMGGYKSLVEKNDKLFSVSIPALLHHITTTSNRGTEGQIWKETEQHLTYSASLSIGGSLLTVGGSNKDGRAMTDISLYHPDTGELRKVGDLPTPRS